MEPSLIERVWSEAHASASFPSWEAFQIVAVVAGGLVVLRGSRRAVVPFTVGVIVAALFAVLLGTGNALWRWGVSGFRESPPEIEVAGFGAMAGLAFGYALAARWTGMPIAPALDRLAPAFGPMLAIARLGCFFAGCDFGAPTDVPWALRYPHFTPAFREELARGVIDVASFATLPVHPTQLYEVAASGALVVLARVRVPFEGGRLALVLSGYAGCRLVVDVFRGDLARSALGLTVSQHYALATLALAFAAVALRAQEDPPRKILHPTRAALPLTLPHAASSSEPASSASQRRAPR